MVAGKAGERPGSTEKLSLNMGSRRGGNGEPPSGPDRVAMQLRTLAGDVRDHILQLFKVQRTPWDKMSEDQQKALIKQAGDDGRWLTESVAEIQAARGYQAFEATLCDYKLNTQDQIEARVLFVNTDDTILGLNRQRRRKIMIVPKEADEFLGERAPAVPDRVGPLGLPITVADGQTGETVGTVP